MEMLLNGLLCLGIMYCVNACWLEFGIGQKNTLFPLEKCTIPLQPASPFTPFFLLQCICSTKCLSILTIRWLAT